MKNIWSIPLGISTVVKALKPLEQFKFVKVFPNAFSYTGQPLLLPIFSKGKRNKLKESLHFEFMIKQAVPKLS